MTIRVRAGMAAVIVCALAAAELRAQSFAAFGSKNAPAALDVPAFSDQDVGGLLTTLDRLLAAANSSRTRESDARDALWQFARRLQSGRLSVAQEARVVAHLDRTATTRPETSAAVASTRRMIEQLTVGKTAPDIVGTDLEGRPLQLSDYRGKVVVLVFSAEWCAICKAQAPYERFLLERYARWPFALLGVQTGSDREAARQTQVADRVAHRAWWDAPREGTSGGDIAGAWNVLGYPASYVIDGEGVIRFVDLRDEDLLKGVRQLVEAHVDTEQKKTRRAP